MMNPVTLRRAAALLLAAALGLAALPGCGNKPAPDKKDEKKDEPKKDDKKGETPVNPGKGGGTVVEPKTSLGPVDKDAEKAAEGFLKELNEGTAKADALSPGFLKTVGKPVDPLPDDIKNGFTRGTATRWLKRVGEGRNFNLALSRQQADTVVLWRGLVSGPAVPGGGGYSLRLLKVDGTWKVDWLGLSSAEMKGTVATNAADVALQEFAVAGFAEVLADATAMTDDTRPLALAHLMTPDLRKAWAAPGKQDQDQGFDYSPGNLRLAAINLGGGTKDFTVAKSGDLTYTVTLNKPTGTKALTVKLAKGATAGEWLVAEAK